MITAEGCAARRDRLWSALDPAPDWLLLGAPLHLTYLTGFYPWPFTFRVQNAGALLCMSAGGDAVLIADNLQQPHLEEAHAIGRVSPLWYCGREPAAVRCQALLGAVETLFGGRPPGRIGVDAGTPAVVVEALRSRRPDLAVAPVDETLHRLRRRKDPDEIAVMRRSMAAGEAGFAAAVTQVRPGMSEVQVHGLVSAAAAESLGEPAVVYGDFASGPRAAGGGGPPTGRRIERGDLFLLDFSVVVRGYRGDFSNTWVVDGKPTPAQRRAESLCLSAMTEGESLLRPGMNCGELDRRIREVFLHGGAELPQGHHSGHGLGLGHPDPPYLVVGSNERLEVGDVVTLEPGQYGPELGGMRFERNYLITAEGMEILTHHRLGLTP